MGEPCKAQLLSWGASVQDTLAIEDGASFFWWLRGGSQGLNPDLCSDRGMSFLLCTRELVNVLNRGTLCECVPSARSVPPR